MAVMDGIIRSHSLNNMYFSTFDHIMTRMVVETVQQLTREYGGITHMLEIQL